MDSRVDAPAVIGPATMAAIDAVAHAIDVFGPDRLMFGSDWPVCLLATSYQRWIEVLSALLEAADEHARSMIWQHTARPVYRLESS